MDEAKKAENQMTSAAAFVEGGIQEACEDACSICLEGFSDSDPATVTSCKHEFHLQCVLEWCQRSSSCPMCWQSIALKDPTSQELLEAVERERTLRFTPSRNAIFHHPTLGNFQVQHIPAGVDAAELEDRIIQHLAAAAAMGRTQYIARREGSMHHRPSSQSREYAVFLPQVNGSSASSGGDETHPVAAAGNNDEGAVTLTSLSATVATPVTRRGVSTQPTLPYQDRAGPSEFQSLSDTWKSRFYSLSMKYKESITKSSKELKEKLFSRSSSMAGISSEVRREVNAGIATVTRMMERLESREANKNPPVAEQRHNVSESSNKSTCLASSSVSR